MSVVQRMKDMTRATFHEMLEKTEDPVQCIDQYLTEKKNKLQQLEAIYSDHQYHLQAMKKQYSDAETMMHKRESQAAVALKADELEVAKLALQEKLAYEEKTEQYKRLVEQGQHSLTELIQQVKSLKQEIQEVSEKRTYYAARMNALRLQQQWQAQSSSFAAKSPDEWLDRLEMSITEMEYETTAMQSLRSQPREKENIYSASIEAELLRLKKQLLGERGKEA